MDKSMFVKSVEINAVNKDIPVDSIHKPITKLTRENVLTK